MKSLILILTLLLCPMAHPCPGGPEGANCRDAHRGLISELQESARLETDILSGRLGERTLQVMDLLLKIGAAELKKKGHDLEAAVILNEWHTQWRTTFKNFVMVSDRPIGDHKGLLAWLTEKYELMEFLLGIELCKKLHISDIKSLNHGIPVVFRACTFPMDGVQLTRRQEFKNHFDKDKNYYGVAPVVAFWIVYGTCGAATAGSGYIFGCGLMGDLAEKLFALITPKLSDTIYTKACGNL